MIDQKTSSATRIIQMKSDFVFRHRWVICATIAILMLTAGVELWMWDDRKGGLVKV